MIPTNIMINNASRRESKIRELRNALSEASVRLEAAKNRGPIVMPSYLEWKSYVKSLEDELLSYLRNLDIKGMDY